MEVLEYHFRPTLRRPLLVAAFRGGWLDVGESASTAVNFLRKAWNTTTFATIDPEEFFDFQVVRPTAVLKGEVREISWPMTEISAGEIPGADRDVVILSGIEPSMRWRTFCGLVMSVVKEVGVETAVTFGALAANVPHTRPVRIMGTVPDSSLGGEYGMAVSRYQGPTAITSVLHDFCRQAGLPSFSLLAAVPHYAGPSPNGSLALVKRLAELMHLTVDTGELDDEVAGYRDRVQKAVEADPEVAQYVRMLERQIDEEAEQAENTEPERIPSGDELAAEFERYLRAQDNEG